MIKKFIENLEKTVASSSIILSSDIQKHFGPDRKTVYLKGRLIFVDSSILEIAIFTSESRNSVSVDKYRYHYMDNQGQMMFRYDNAPHHREISSFPHHKHTPDGTIQSITPSLRDILNEVSAIIIRK